MCAKCPVSYVVKYAIFFPVRVQRSVGDHLVQFLAQVGIYYSIPVVEFLLLEEADKLIVLGGQEAMRT